jgi:hypothetical protein
MFRCEMGLSNAIVVLRYKTVTIIILYKFRDCIYRAKSTEMLWSSIP